MSRSTSAALPIAYIFIRILIVLNWVFGALVLALLLFTFSNEPWTMMALGVTGFSDARQVMWAMRAVAALGIAALFETLEPADDVDVPATSVLREFIGGSTLKIPHND